MQWERALLILVGVVLYQLVKYTLRKHLKFKLSAWDQKTTAAGVVHFRVWQQSVWRFVITQKSAAGILANKGNMLKLFAWGKQGEKLHTRTAFDEMVHVAKAELDDVLDHYMKMQKMQNENSMD